MFLYKPWRERFFSFFLLLSVSFLLWVYGNLKIFYSFSAETVTIHTAAHAFGPGAAHASDLFLLITRLLLQFISAVSRPLIHLSVPWTSIGRRYIADASPLREQFYIFPRQTLGFNPHSSEGLPREDVLFDYTKQRPHRHILSTLWIPQSVKSDKYLFIYSNSLKVVEI